MKEFTKVNISELRRDMEDALLKVADTHGISINIGRITYSSHECRGSFTSTCKKDENGNIIPPIEKAYMDIQSKGMMNLGDTFESGGSTFTIAGWKPNNTKYPLIANNEMGRAYKFASRYAFK